MTSKLTEILTGLVVIAVAVVFLLYALGRADTMSGTGYKLKAQFSGIGGLTTGADVKIGGVVVGHVMAEHLDPQTYAAVVDLQIDDNIKIPADTSAAISSDGLLSGPYVALSPGGSDIMLAAGQSFAVTQSAINIEDLLGKFIFSMGSSANKPAAGTPAAGGVSNPAALPNPAGASSSK